MRARTPVLPKRSLFAVLLLLAACMSLQSCTLLMDEFFQLAKAAPRLDRQVMDMDQR